MGVSRRAADFVMAVISATLLAGFSYGGAAITPIQQDILSQIPPTVESALSRFRLEGKTTTFAVCPTCHCTYGPRFALDSTTPLYPDFCDNIPEPEIIEPKKGGKKQKAPEPARQTSVPGKRCGERLLHAVGSDGIAKPIKTYVFHSFHDYLAGLLSRPDLESAMDKASDDFMKCSHEPPPPYVADIFEAEFLKTFEGPQAGQLFLDRGEEGRYGFSLFVDFFTVGGMTVRGAKDSCGIIAMACLNLPIHLRFKPENIYLAGLVPGPREPHIGELNHYLRPLIEEMGDSWERGIRYPRTATQPLGKTTRSAIVNAVNDLPGARKVAALAGVTAIIYCTVCPCRGKHTLGCYNYKEWGKRDAAEMRQQAENFKNASTTKEQVAIFECYGVRWSEMWSLPYWNPVRQLVIDAMHCILEGLIQSHFRHILKLSTKAAKAKTVLTPALVISFSQLPEDNLTGKDLDQIQGIRSLLAASIPGDNAQEIEESFDKLRNTLANKRKSPLVWIGKDFGLEAKPKLPGRQPTTPDWADALLAWVGALNLYTKYPKLNNFCSGAFNPTRWNRGKN